VFQSEHGGAFVSENTEYVIESAQYPSPLGGGYVPLEEFNEKYRGGATYWKFDRTKGRIDASQSFAVELPPYSQDLSDFGKLASSGWSFTNSFCTERYVGGIERGRPPFEAGCSGEGHRLPPRHQLEEGGGIGRGGQGQEDQRLQRAAARRLGGGGRRLPDPRAEESPRRGRHAGRQVHHRLGQARHPHLGLFLREDPAGDRSEEVRREGSVRSAGDFARGRAADAGGTGLGPLHTQYDSRPGIAYTSLYVDSMVAKWDYINGKLLDRLPIHYNIGHIMAMHGDTREAARQVRRGAQQARHRPLQPCGSAASAEPPADRHLERQDAAPLRHAGAARRAALRSGDRRDPAQADRPLPGRDQQPHRRALAVQDQAGEEKIVRNGKKVDVFGTEIRSHLTPEIIEVEEGDQVSIHLTTWNGPRIRTHASRFAKYNVNGSLEPGKTSSFTFVADKARGVPVLLHRVLARRCTSRWRAICSSAKGYKGTAVEAKAGATYTKAEYDKQMEVIVQTQKAIDDVVAYVTARNYKQYPPVAALMDDAVDQLGKVPDAKAKAEEYAAKQDWSNATLWANQWWQYQVKAATSACAPKPSSTTSAPLLRSSRMRRGPVGREPFRPPV